MSVKPQSRSVVGVLKISPMQRRHLRSVLAIEQQVYPRPWSATLFLSELSQRSTRSYTVGTVGPLVVGYAGLMVVGEEGHVNTLSVDPGWQRRGVATMLLADLARTAMKRGVRHLTLEVRAGNGPAQALYRKFGFGPVGLRRNYYSETGEDAVVMWVRDIDTQDYVERLAGLLRSLEPARGSRRDPKS